MLAVMHDSRGVNEVNHVRIVGAGGELEGEEVFVEAHGSRMKGDTYERRALDGVVSGVTSFVAAAKPEAVRRAGNKPVRSVHYENNKQKRSLNKIPSQPRLRLDLIADQLPTHPHSLCSGPPTIW